MTKEARKIFYGVGGEKVSTASRRKEEISVKTSLMEINRLEAKAMSRVVMRHPHADVLGQLQFTHQRMAEEFLCLSDEALTWLLGGSSETSRGGFQDGPAQKASEKLREFLSANSKTIPHQRLISGIETIATAMGYRAVHASWTTPPFCPQTPEQKLMASKIQHIIKDKLTPPIGDVYKDRWADDLKANPITNGETIIGQQEDVSSASESEQEDRLPKKLLDSRVFRKYAGKKGQYSWIGSAEEGGIAIRAHTSGTCPLTLAAIDGLCSSGSGFRRVWLNHEDHFKAFAGAVAVATFQRGDYHSIAETAAGIKHYLIERAIKNGQKIKNTPMKPYDAFKEGLAMLVAASSTEKVDTQDSLSIKEAMQVQAHFIVSRTKEVKEKQGFYTEEAFLKKQHVTYFSSSFYLKKDKHDRLKNDKELGYEADFDQSSVVLK